MNGIINVLKPPGMTSNDVIAKIKKKLVRGIKIGHTGTLDPEAAGVLVICLGKATRFAEFILEKPKRYRAEIVIGIRTDTQDLTGNILHKEKVCITEQQVVDILDYFQGEQTQIPPMYSAIKIKGQKLYDLARKGIEIERKPREISLYQIELIKYLSSNRFIFDVTCSKGTYIRTLCEDIGKALGTCGCMAFLLRTRVGDFSINDSFALEEVIGAIEENQLENLLVTMDRAVNDYSRVDLSNQVYVQAINGHSISTDDILNKEDIKEGQNIRAYINNEFIGIGRIITNSEDKNTIKFSKIVV